MCVAAATYSRCDDKSPPHPNPPAGDAQAHRLCCHWPIAVNGTAQGGPPPIGGGGGVKRRYDEDDAEPLGGHDVKRPYGGPDPYGPPPTGGPETVLRLLVSTKRVGSIIGKGGTVVKQVRGAAWVSAVVGTVVCGQVCSPARIEISGNAAAYASCH